MAEKLLIVVDFQNDFVTGSLGFEKATKLDEKICQRICDFRNENNDVAFTLDTHNSDYLVTQEGKNLPVEHCIKGTNGHKLFGKTAKMLLESDAVFEKPTFPSLELGIYLKSKSYKTVELCGLVSNICVISNAIIAKSALPEAEIVVNSALTASADEQLHEKAMEVMQGLQITVVRN